MLKINGRQLTVCKVSAKRGRGLTMGRAVHRQRHTLTPVLFDVWTDVQVVRFRAELVSEARRADRSLADLLSVGDVVRVSATTASRRTAAAAAGGRHDEEEVVLAQPATLTVSSPPSPAAGDAAATAAMTGRGKLNMLTYRGGRVDSTAECVPCAYDFTARKRRVDVRVWQLSGIGYGAGCTL